LQTTTSQKKKIQGKKSDKHSFINGLRIGSIYVHDFLVVYILYLIMSNTIYNFISTSMDLPDHFVTDLTDIIVDNLHKNVFCIPFS
jgi:hypothetical protein